jgi:hypothetical protein
MGKVRIVFLVITLLLSAVATPPRAVAVPQSEVVFSSLGIDLWPDYDRPGVLVIYRANVAPGVALPAPVTLRIPAAAGAPSAVAERQADGQLINLQYERRVEGDVALIDMTVTRPIVQLEYYDPSIERDGAARSFTFTWAGDYEVGELSISAQQPDLARGLTLDPPAASRSTGADGLVYHTVSFTGLDAGESVAVDVSYEKANDQLSVETMAPVEPEATPTPQATSAGDTEIVVIVVIALLAAALIVIGYALFRGRRRPRGPRPAAAAGPAGGGGSGGTRFCTQCGAGADPGDRFCASCGTPLR